MKRYPIQLYVWAIVFALAILAVVALWIVPLSHAQELPPQSAYVLDHPIDPDLLILATPDGRFPIARLSECGWLRSDMNVTSGFLQSHLGVVTDGQQTCYVAISDMVDSTPCFANDAGACDIEAGEHYWPTD
jgi:hypothetical protein